MWRKEDHHSHIICIKCKQITFGIFSKCECNKFDESLDPDPDDEETDEKNDENKMTTNKREVKEATFITA